MPIRLLIVDDHAVVAESLAVLFGTNADFEVVGTARNAQQALDLLETTPTDVLLTDLAMPGLDGIALVGQVRRHFPAVRTLLLTMNEDAPKIRDAIRVGVTGYVLKNEDRATLERAVRQVAAGQRFFSEAVVLELAAYDEPLMAEAIPASLTARELEILILVCQELTNQEIADRLFISIPTVETHRRHLMQKVGCKTAIGLAKFALKHGLV
ncbi:MAG: response regulator transcription factor [Cytophagaceae bacterium]|nr:response regulator transcription factor [Cytophagaceae bacterium]